jgi:hypothetical protein
MKKVLWIMVLAMAATSAFATNGHEVNATAAMAGTNYGFEVILDEWGCPVNDCDVYVQDDTPATETTYRATFWFDPNSIAMDPYVRFPIFFGRSENNQPNFRLQLMKDTLGGGYYLRMQARKNNNDYVHALNTVTGTQWLLVPDAPLQITIEIRYAQGSISETLVRMYANGQIHERVGDFWNSNFNCGKVQLGAPRMDFATGPVLGSLYFDEFASFRTLTP